MGNKGYGFSVFLSIDFGDVAAVAEYLAFLDVVESFEEGNYAGLATARRPDQCGKLSFFNLQATVSINVVF